jgi:hypothetical protein
MSDPEQPRESRPEKATAKGNRHARAAALEKALRDNLRRRKAAAAESSPRSEALGQNQSQSLHEKAKEKPEGSA